MKINMKRLLIVVVVITILLSFVIYGFIKVISYYRVKNAEKIVVLSDNMKTEVYSDVKINDFIEEINGDLIENTKIDTTKVGKKKIEFEYINEDKIKVPYSYTIEVVDETKRLMLIIFEQSLLIKMITQSKTLHYSFVTFNTPAILRKDRWYM